MRIITLELEMTVAMSEALVFKSGVTPPAGVSPVLCLAEG